MSEAVGESILDELQGRFPGELTPQETRDGIPTLWVSPERAHALLRYLKEETRQPYKMLFDLTAIDERERLHREGQPESDFTVVYTLLSYERNADIRLKVALKGENPSLPSITDIWPMANWYERELWDMFGITATGHPFLRRILMPPTWQGHPLRKEHPARGTEIHPYIQEQIKAMEAANALQFNPDEWDMPRGTADTDYMFLNVGPQHPGTHGPFRIILALDGEEIVDAVPDIGFHHRAQEKMAERQSWHTYIPYTDRVDYLAGVLNEFPYVMAVEKLAGIDVPPRAQLIRVLVSELFRISNHLVFLGTFAQDLGAMSPVFYMFNDREKLFTVIEAITGARMHPGWFRIGGTSADLPKGWEKLVTEFLDFMPAKLDEYDRVLFDSPIFRDRTVGIARVTPDMAIEWGMTGPFLRSTGFAWDWRKQRPYSCYDQLDFDIPVGETGDCYDRAVVHAREIRESLRIIRQCVESMPAGPYKSAHPATTPPVKEYTMHDIETLITHFLNVSWGPQIPTGEALVTTENSKGANGYYLISDGSTTAYRAHIRTPSFAHLQTIPLLARGLMVPDLLAILGSIDFVMGDVDR